MPLEDLEVARIYAGPALRTRWLVAIASASTLLAAIGLAAYYADSQAAFGYEYALTLAEWQGGWVFGAIALGIGVVSTGISALVVRPCLRGVLAFINRGPIRSGQIAALWVADSNSGPEISEALKPTGDD